MGWRVTPTAIAAAQDLLERFSLGDLSARSIRALSGGQQQRAALVQHIYRGSALLALDEPTSALDLHHQLAALHDLPLAARFF